MAIGQVVGQDLIAVTEKAAIAAAQTMGFGDGIHSDRAAVEAMRAALDEAPLIGRIVIGEGEPGEAPMLYIGEQIGGGRLSSSSSETEDRAIHKTDTTASLDIAIDPLEGADLCATGAPGAVSVLAASDVGGLLGAPDVYMDKIVVGPTARNVVHIDAPVAENLRAIARTFQREVSDLTVVVLDRERNRQLIADIRATGARIRLIPDGDLSAGISAAVRGTGVHAVLGTGGAPEGVLTAVAMRCLGGEIQARLRPRGSAQRERLAAMGIADLERIYSTRELAPGDDIVFTCTGVTDGELLRGVRFFGGGCRTSTLFMSLASRTIRFVDTIHRDDISGVVHFR